MPYQIQTYLIEEVGIAPTTESATLTLNKLDYKEVEISSLIFPPYINNP
jgi:hypothetical protein